MHLVNWRIARGGTTGDLGSTSLGSIGGERLLRLFAAIVLATATMTHHVSAAVHYVDPAGGDDGNSGTESAPWRSLSKAQGTAIRGDTVILKDGRYGAMVVKAVESTRTGWITYRAQNRHRAIVDYIDVGNEGHTRDCYLRFEGLKISIPAPNPMPQPNGYWQHQNYPTPVVCSNVNYVEFRDCIMEGFNKYLVQRSMIVSSCNNVLVSGCEMRNMVSGIQISGSNNTTVRNCYIHSGVHGTCIRILTGNRNTVIHSNHITDIYHDSRDTYFPYNTVGTSDWHIGTGIGIRSSSVRISNNVIRNTTGLAQAMMFYTRDGDTIYDYCNMLIENNLVYPGCGLVRLYNINSTAEAPVVIRNNAFFGRINWGTRGMEAHRIVGRYNAAMELSFSSGCDGTGTSLHNNVFLGQWFLPTPGDNSYNYTEDYNIFWSRQETIDGSRYWQASGKGPHTLMAVWRDGYAGPLCGNPNLLQDVGYRASTSQYSYSEEKVIDFFVRPHDYDHEAETETLLPNWREWDYHLAANSPGINFGDALKQPATSLGRISSDGFIRNDGPSRNSSRHSVGPYEYDPQAGENTDNHTPHSDSPGHDAQADGTSPRITAIGAWPVSPGQTVGVSVSENATLTFSVSATDPDGDPIAYSATGLPSGASFSGRTFRWTPTYGQAGNYQVTFTASDGQNQDSATITITVVKVNRAPVLGEIDDRFIDQDQSVAFPLAASDPDGDSLTYSASGLPAGASLTGGSFSWTPSASQVGSHNITFVVSDGDLQDRQSVTIVVAGTGPDGTAPTVARRSPEPEAIQVSLNNLVTLHVTDGGRGVNPESVVIRVDDAIVYQGDVSAYESANGRCSRSGMPNDYRFIYQANEPFTFDHTVRVTVNAADRAGNVMSAHSYSFTTEMRAFGSNWAVSAGFGVSGPKSRPATVSNAAGTIWVVWCSGAEGQRDIYASRMPAGSDGFEAPVAITTASADQSHPRIAQDGNGTLYVVWQDKQRGNWDIFMAVSTDGVTWSRPIQVTDSDGNETYPAIAADTRSPSRVYIAWQDDRDGNADIFVASSVNAFSDSVTSRLTTDLADQLAPDIAVGPEDIAYVVWTDRRRGQADLYGARSGASDWSNTPLVTTNSGQSNPAIAFCRDSSTLHLLWVDDAPGHKDIYHAAMDGWPAQPVTGESIIDDTSGADQLAPAIVSAAGSRIFACWQDRRHAGRRSADTDLFVAELGPDAAGTNIFVGDDRTNSGQSEPAIGIDGYDNPYLVWTDARGSNTEIYFAATTFLDPTPLDARQVVASVGATVGTDPAAIAQPDDVSIVVPPRACRSDTRISISRILNPPVAPADCLGSYDFGPSGIDFAIPVTVTIPYRFSGTGGSAKPYWYDSLTGALTQHGITDIENLVVAPNLNALRFKTTHFTPFYVVADTSPLVEGDSGSGGGCSISTTGGGSPKDLLMPYAVVAIAVIVLRRRDRRRRHSLETVHG